MPRTPRSPRTSSTKKSPPSPQEIAPGVFLGGWNDAVKFRGKKFCVLDEAPEEMPSATHVPIYDGATDAPILPNLDRVASEMNSAQRAKEPVLVFCGHGIRRSPLAAAWYLHRYEKLSLEDAYERIRAVRPKVETAREWIGNWKKLEG
ncbi:MAG TPA: dual specificity protein phosphatase [Thermoplasmata archaeon]|nr:dual specificity protein phosphatase [Thermoplasmata archaeon]